MRYKVRTDCSFSGYQVIEADSPKEAYKIAERNTFDKTLPYMDLSDCSERWYKVEYDDPVIWNLDFSKGWDASGAEWPNYDIYKDQDGFDPLNIGSMHFIWGIKSYDDLSAGADANFYTMNDIDFYYDDEDNKYHLSIEGIYVFDDDDGRFKYYRSLADAFRLFISKKYGYSKEELNNVSHCNVDYYGTYICGVTPLDIYHKLEIFIATYKVIHKLRLEGLDVS